MINCDEPNRRQKTRAKGLNGLDYVEVSKDCHKLYLYFLGDAPEKLAKEHIRIDGGVQIRDIRVLDVTYTRGGHNEDGYVTVHIDKPGDYSLYTLRLVNPPDA